MDSPVIKCSDCGKLLEADMANCPVCESPNRSIGVADTIHLAVAEQIRLKEREPDSKKPTRELIAGDDWSSQREKYVDKYQLVDRKNNAYKKKVVDKETGEIIRECEESLTEHQGYGSAKESIESEDKS